jgi:transposase
VLVSFDDLLNLPQVRVVDAQLTETEITLQVEHSQHFAICHKCGARATEFFRNGEKLVLRHLPIFNRPVFLVLQTKRYRCLHCDGDTTTTQQGDWYDAVAHCTKAFAQFLLLELVNSTISDVASKHQVSYDLLRGVLERYVAGEVDWSQFDRLRVLGLDEISLLKGHKDFVTIVSTRDEAGQPVVLAVLKGREKKTVVEFLKSIPEHLRATIEQACTDLYDGFANAIKEVLPHVKLVADRFHVAKLYRAAVDDLRKQEMKELKKILNKEQYAGLKGVMWKLRRNFEDLSEEDRQLLELLFECSPTLRRAHALREKLTAIFERKLSKAEATRLIQAWMEEVKQSGLKCFDKFLGTLENWMEEITNYFISRLSSGWVEGLNNKIKVLKRRCYGLSNIGNLFRRISLDLQGRAAFA